MPGALGDAEDAEFHSSVVGVGCIDADDGAGDLHAGVGGEDGAGEEFGVGSGWPNLRRM